MSNSGWVIPASAGRSAIRLAPKEKFRQVSHGNRTAWIASPFSGRQFDQVVTAVMGSDTDRSLCAIPFSAVVVDENDNLSAYTDRFGQVPMYWHESDNEVRFSPSLRWLVNQPDCNPTADEQALGELLTLKFILGSKTLFKSIKRLPPASTRRFSCGSWQDDFYWRPYHSGARRHLNTEVETLSELFVAGIQQGIDPGEPVAITLSGGLDSRAVLAAALAVDAQVNLITTGIEGGMDHRFASQAAAAVGLPLKLAVLDVEYQKRFFEFARCSIDTYEGMLLTPGTEAFWMLEELQGVDVSVVFHGALGELAKGRTANHFEVATREIDACNTDVGKLLASRYSPTHDRTMQLLSPTLRKTLTGEALQSIRETSGALAQEMEAIDVPFAMQILEHFRNSGVYSSKIWQQKAPLLFPFANPAYVDHMLMVRAEDRIEPKFHRALLEYLNDSLYRCPESNTGVAPCASDFIRRASSFRVKVKEKLGFKSAAGHTDFGSWINAMEPSIEEVLLGNNVRTAEFWDADAVRTTIGKSIQGDGAAASDLYRLLCVELTFQSLLD